MYQRLTDLFTQMYQFIMNDDDIDDDDDICLVYREWAC